MNKKIAILLILLSVLLTGCKKTPKAPDNFDKDLWEDSVKIIEIIHKTYNLDNNFSVEDEDKIEEYFDIYQGRVYNNNDEYIMIKTIQTLYNDYKDYLFSKRAYSDDKITKEDKLKVLETFKEIQDKYEGLIK